MRDGVLKITAAPAGQPGSPIGLLPTPPNLSAIAGCDDTAMIARTLITTMTVPNRVRWAMGSPLDRADGEGRWTMGAADPNVRRLIGKTIYLLGRCAAARKKRVLCRALRHVSDQPGSGDGQPMETRSRTLLA